MRLVALTIIHKYLNLYIEETNKSIILSVKLFFRS